jgi:hypothetical protein
MTSSIGLSNNNYKNAEIGWVYCIVNYRDRDYVKIGMTTKALECRLREANGTFTTEGFYVVIAKYVRRPYDREQLIHQLLADRRVMTNREFFDVRAPGTLRRVLMLFDLMEGDVYRDSRRTLHYGMTTTTTTPSTTTTSLEERNVGDQSPPSEQNETVKSFLEGLLSIYMNTENPEDEITIGDVTENMQRLGFSDSYEYMRAHGYALSEPGMVYRGLKHRYGSLNLGAYVYDSSG